MASLRRVIFLSAASSALLRATTAEECPEGTLRADSERWVGTAPFCSGSPSDCTNIGYEYVRSDSSGDGSSCFSGQKVLCRKSTCRADDNYNPLCNSQLFRISVVGTAPFCAATDCDCLKLGSIPFQAESEVTNPCVDVARFYDAGGILTKPCTTGTHVLCLKPDADLMAGPTAAPAEELNRNIEMQKKMCINGQTYQHEERMAMMKLAGEIVAAAAKAGAAR